MKAVFDKEMTLEEFVLKYRAADIDGVAIPLLKIESLSKEDFKAFTLFLRGKGLPTIPKFICLSPDKRG